MRFVKHTMSTEVLFTAMHLTYAVSHVAQNSHSTVLDLSDKLAQLLSSSEVTCDFCCTQTPLGSKRRRINSVLNASSFAKYHYHGLPKTSKAGSLPGILKDSGRIIGGHLGLDIRGPTEKKVHSSSGKS